MAKEKEERGTVLEERVTTYEGGEKDKSLDEREKSLPDENKLSRKEINSIESSREMDEEDLCELVGTKEPYEGWMVRVRREGPEVYAGASVEQRRIKKLKVPGTWTSLVDRIEKQHGGGRYRVQFFDQRNKPRRQKTFDIDGTPKFDPAVYPEFAEVQVGTNNSDAQVHDLENEMKKKQIYKQMEAMDKSGNGDMGGMLGLFKLQNESTERRLNMMENNQREAAREARELNREMMHELKETMEAKPQEDSNKGTTDVIMALKDSTDANLKMMMEFTVSKQDSMMESFKESTKMQMKNQSDMMTMFMGMQGKDNTMEIFSILQNSDMHKSDRSVDLILAVLPMLLDKEDADPKMEVFKYIMEVIGKGSDLFDNMNKIQQAKAKRLPHTPTPTPGPAPKKEPGQQEAAVPKHEAVLDVLTEYRNTEENQRWSFLVTQLVTESGEQPVPEESIFCGLVLDEATPDLIPLSILSMETCADFKGEIEKGMVDERTMTILNATVFKNEESCAWTTTVIQYLKAKVEAMLDEGEEEPVEEELIEDEVVFQCPHCDFAAKSKSGLTRHMNAQHKPDDAEPLDGEKEEPGAATDEE